MEKSDVLLSLKRKEKILDKKKTVKSKMNFEASLKDLEEVASSLESGELGLDESIKEFEKGVKLAKFCHDKLEEAERKIEILQKGEDNEVKSRPVKIKSDTGEVEDDGDLQGSLL